MHQNGDDKMLINDVFEDETLKNGFDTISIALVKLDPTIGSEMKKTRPCLVISPDEMNRYLNTIVVAPMTSSSKSYPTRVEVIK